MASTSLWQTELDIRYTARLAFKPLQGKHTTDVVVIGAGITGTAVALWLARAGIEVRVIEARQIAAGASGRNGGFIATGTTQPYEAVITHYGRDEAKRLWNFSVKNATLAAQLVDALGEHGWDCGYRRLGSLKLATSAAELELIYASALLLRQDGWDAEIVERQDLPEQLQAAYYGGSYHAGNAEIHPTRFVAGLAYLAQREGAIFHQESPVLSISESDDGVSVKTQQGEIEASTLVLATNAWLPPCCANLNADWITRCIVPTRGQMLATEPVAERIVPYPCSADEGYQYWRQLQDGRLVIGGWRNRSFGTENSLDETPNELVQQHLEAFVSQTLNLPATNITHRWAGIMAFSADGLPLVGELPGTIHTYIAGGYTGHGNAYALQASQIISELILGHLPSDAYFFDPIRFTGTDISHP